MLIHIVEPGETAYGIAARYGVSPARLLADNGLSASDTLAVGQALLVLIPAEVYTVQPGDTLYSIAGAAGTSVLALVQNNPYLTDADALRPGEELVLRYTGDKRRSVYTTGYAYPYINRNVLYRALPYLSYLTIFGYGFTETGDLIGIDDVPLIEAARAFGAAPVMLLSSITESGNFNSARASRLFNDADLQATVLDNVLATMQQKGYAGLDIDFEYIDPADREAFVAFVAAAEQKLSPYGYFVNTDLAPKTSAAQSGLLYEAHDYAALGEASDTLFLMTYEWGYTYGPPLAVAPMVTMIAPSASMTIHPVRTSGTIIAAPQTYQYFERLQERIVRFVTKNSRIGRDEFLRLMMDTQDLASDVGSVLYGEEAVACGLIRRLGSLSDALEALYALIDEKKKSN